MASNTSCNMPIIAVLGPTGVGKSTLINTMLSLALEADGSPGVYPDGTNKPYPVGTSAGAQSHTSMSSVVQGRLLDGSPCAFVDTPGLGDSKGRDSAHIADMVRQLKAVGTINSFLIVVSGAEPRLDASHRAMIGIFSEVFGAEFMRNIVIVKTNWFQDPISRQRREQEMQSQGIGLTPEEYTEREFQREIAREFNYTGVMKPVIFIDSKPLAIAGQEEKRMHTAALQSIAETRRFAPFICRDIKEVQTLLDRTEAQITNLKKSNDAMKEQFAKEREAHAKELQAIRDRMAKDKSDHEQEIARLNDRIRDAERTGGGDGGDSSGLLGLLLLLLLGGGGRGGGGGSGFGGGGGAMVSYDMGASWGTPGMM